MKEKKNIVTIDGPSGVGKSTLSKMIAFELRYVYLDTGAMYRAVGYHLNKKDVDLRNDDHLKKVLEKIELSLYPAENLEDDVRVVINGNDVSKKIRTPEMSMIASTTSANSLVRQKLTEMQREYGEKGNIVAEGRDTGTVVFPHAKYKFFLEATPETRTKRRALQLMKKGEYVDEKELFSMIVERDKNDRERPIAPLKKADDAILIDTSNMTKQEVKEEILRNITSKKVAD